MFKACLCSGRLFSILNEVYVLIIAPVGPLRERKLLLEDRPLRIQVLTKARKTKETDIPNDARLLSSCATINSNLWYILDFVLLFLHYWFTI